VTRPFIEQAVASADIASGLHDWPAAPVGASAAPTPLALSGVIFGQADSVAVALWLALQSQPQPSGDTVHAAAWERRPAGTRVPE